jgi:Xaa-Pro aminopeptidase
MWAKQDCEVPESQFQQRCVRVSQFAEERGLGAVVAFSAPRIHQWTQTGHVGYLTNWSNLDRVTDTMVVVPAGGEPVLLVSGLEYMFDQIEEVSWIKDVRLVSSPDPRSISGAYDESVAGEQADHGVKTYGQQVRDILNDHDLRDRSIGIAGVESIPSVLYRDLSDSVGGNVADIPDIVADLRGIKSPEEVSILRQTAAVSDRSYETMMEILTDGMWGYELTAAMDHTARRAGGDLVYHCMHSAPGGDLSAGKLSIKPHDMRLHRGDYINVNAYVVYKGYWIQGDRAGTIGDSLGGSAAAALEANLEAQDEVLAAIRPGLTIGEMVAISNGSAERRGYYIQGGRIGHGQGLDYSEQPFLIAGSEETLKPGHVFVLHVCVGIPDTNILLNPIADLCHVTEDGVEVLNKFPREIFHA